MSKSWLPTYRIYSSYSLERNRETYSKDHKFAVADVWISTMNRRIEKSGRRLTLLKEIKKRPGPPSPTVSLSPFPGGAAGAVFQEDAGFGQPVADFVGAVKVLLGSGGIAFLDQVVHLIVRQPR